jgi:dipeptidyl aminopeptidase/acylaminoacyl peptidase
MTTTAPYGTWASPITAEMLASDDIGLSECRLDHGVAYWLERRSTEGRSVLVKGDPFSSPVDVTSAGFDVRSMAHEYGGGAYTVHDGTVYFVNKVDQRLYRQTDGGTPQPITPDTDAAQRFADGVVTDDGRWWIGVRERHDLGPAVADVVNELIAIPTDGAAPPRTIVGGRDFYAAPEISPDGSTLSFLAWDLPWMPWDGCELFVAPLAGDAEVGDAILVAGRDGEESIWQPTWSPAGDLVFASDRSGWWNLERITDGRPDGERAVIHAAEAEFGYPMWTFGERSFAFLADGHIVCLYDQNGRTHVALLDPTTGQLTPMDLPYDALGWGLNIATEGMVILLIAGSTTTPEEVAWLDFSTRAVEVLRSSVTERIDPAFLSAPLAIEFPTEGDRMAHAFFYPPTNPDFEGIEDEGPPLIVMSHGGPTSEATGIYDLTTQYWTSRGFAVVDVNYGGSTGYGRAYRQRLNGNWGVVDLQDCVNAARFLVEAGHVDGDRLMIRGGSAGGYTTICALTFTDVFAAGATYFGIADLVPFATGDTHKFESRYEHTLVGPWPEAEATYRERSAINFVDRISTPMLVLQGSEDHVVPPSQAELIVAALRERGLPHAYLLFEGEGHGFREAKTMIQARNVELSFYAQILGFEPAGDIPRLAIENLPSR